MKIKKWISLCGKKRLGIMCAMLVLTLLAAGCKQSPVLEKVVYTTDVSLVDQTQQWLDPEDQGKEDEDFRNEEREDADTQREENNDAAVQGDDSTNKDAGQQVAYDNRGSSDLTAESKGKSAAGTGSGGGGNEGDLDELDELNEGTGNSSDTENGETDGKNDGSSQDGAQNGDENSVPKDTPSHSDSEKETVTDGNGTQKEIPTDAMKVAAPGAAAEIVEMVAGNGYLAASSESFVDNSIAKHIFSDVSDGKVKALWSNTGKTNISDVSKLTSIEGLNYCFYFNGQSLSDAQIKKLEEAGITCLALPSLDSAEHLKQAVTLVATAFKETTDGESLKTATAYSDWVDDAEDAVKKSDFVRYGLYISDWRSDITYTFSSGDPLKGKGNYNYLPSSVCRNGTGQGVAIAWTKYKSELLSTFMSAAGVINVSTDFSLASKYKAIEGYYMIPMGKSFTPLKFSDKSFIHYESSEDTNVMAYDMILSYQTGNNSYIKLGESDLYPALIVKDSSVKEKIQSNWFWQYSSTKYTYYDEDKGENFSYYGGVGGDYDIWVNPSGVGDWAEGSVESPLEGYWIAYMYGNGTTSKSTLESAVKQFYKKFYGADISSYMSDILKRSENGS